MEVEGGLADARRRGESKEDRHVHVDGSGSGDKEKEKSENEVKRGYVPSLEDVRIALFFLFFVQVGFFGTGKCVFFSHLVLFLTPSFILI